MRNGLAASSQPAGPPPPPALALVRLPPPPPLPTGFRLRPLGGSLGAGTSAGRGSERTPGNATSSAAGTAEVGGACCCLLLPAAACPPNPDTFEEYHRKCKELFPIQMVALSTIRESTYHFGHVFADKAAESYRGVPCAGMHGRYHHKASDQLQVGVEFEASTRMQDASVSLRYQLDLPKANLLFKGSVDSNWIVGATLEKLPLLPPTLALQAFLNHRKNKFQCSFCLTIR
ncbi:Mitochondrial import receptor subunit TOM40-like protein, partial [Plecturocebus cupreus]